MNIEITVATEILSLKTFYWLCYDSDQFLSLLLNTFEEFKTLQTWVSKILQFFFPIYLELSSLEQVVHNSIPNAYHFREHDGWAMYLNFM